MSGDLEQETVQNIPPGVVEVVESAFPGDTSALLKYDGWHLLGVAKNPEGSDERFTYSLGCTKDIDDWSEFEKNFLG